MGMSATEYFGFAVVGRADHGGQKWIVFDDGQYRFVVEAKHFDDTGFAASEPDDERRADNYTDWCRRGLWAKDDVAAEVAGLCDLTHVHSAESGGCGRVDAVEPVEGNYKIAFVKADGSWDVVESFVEASDATANEYAERNYADREWYVLDASGNNING